MSQFADQRRTLAIIYLLLVVTVGVSQVLFSGETWVYGLNLFMRCSLVLIIAMRLRQAGHSKRRQIWGVLLLASVLDALASAIFSFSTLVQGEITQPIFAPLGDLLQLAAYVAVAIALMAMREKSRPVADWRVPVLDASVIVVALSAMTWLLVLGNISAGVELTGLANFLLQLGYPFLDFTLLACLLIVRSRPNSTVSGSLLSGISVFVLSLFVGDGLIGVGFYLTQAYQVPVLIAAGAFQNLALAVLGITALTDRPAAASVPAEDTNFGERSWHLSSATVAALFLVALYFLGRNMAAAKDVISIELVVLVSMVVTGLMLIIRQTVSGSRVRSALEVLVQERTEKLAASTRALEAANLSLRSLTDHAPIAICARDKRGVLIYDNTVWREMAQMCPEILNWQPSNSDALQELNLPAANGDVRHFYGGKAEYLDGTGQVTGQWLMLSDVTEQKLQEAQLFNLSKLASLGEMATGVAHEMNQPLHALRLAMTNLKHQVNRPDFVTEPGLFRSKLIDKFSRMDDMVTRCDSLIKQMRTFGKAVSVDVLPARLVDVVEEATLLFSEQLRLQNIDLTNAVDPGAWVLCAVDQLEQVLINLISNARDAMSDSARKEIRLKTERNGDHWQLHVADTGSGIDAALKHRLFEPFFSTKEVNQGTGLGLSISYGLINEMGGTLSLDNNTDHGATATITLPAAAPASP